MWAPRANMKYSETSKIYRSPETIMKIRVARARQVITPETKAKISMSLHRAWNDGTRKKEDCPFWKGSITDENKMARKTLEYKLWREAVFTRDDWTCQECGERGGELHPHHIKPFALFPELRTAIDNGITLCRKCHTKTDTWGLRIGTQS